MKIKPNILFYIGYFLLVITDTCTTIEIIKIFDNYIKLIAYVLLVIHILINLHKIKFKKKEIMVLAMILVALLTIYIKSRNFTMNRILLLLFGMQFIDYDSFLKKDIFFKLLIIALLTVLPVLNIIDMNILLRSDLSKRYSFGFVHPNTMANYITFIIYEVYYVAHIAKKNSIMKILKYVLIPIALLFILLINNSRTAFGLLFIFWIYTLFNNYISNIIKKNIKNKSIILEISKKIICNQYLLFLLMTILVIGISKINTSFFTFVNKIFSNRIYNNTYYINHFGLSMFGNIIPVSVGSIYLDSLYLKNLLNFGVVGTILFALLYRFTINNSFSKKNYILIIILCLTCIEGLTETNVILPTLNVFILADLYKFTQKYEEEKKNGVLYN